MKKLTTLLLLIFSLLAFNNCSDEVIGTKDINYVSFEVQFTPTIIVEKNRSTDAKKSIYMLRKLQVLTEHLVLE